MAMNKERLFTELTNKFEEEGIQVARQPDSGFHLDSDEQMQGMEM